MEKDGFKSENLLKNKKRCSSLLLRNTQEKSVFP